MNVALAPTNGAAPTSAEQPTEHRRGRGGYRQGSGRPKMEPDQKRVRMSVGFTGDNLRWLRQQSQDNHQPIARILNDLVTNEVARQRATEDDGVIDAAVNGII